MPKTGIEEGLAAAAAHLCAAHEELVVAGYETWSAEIRMLLEIIDVEMDWLREHRTSMQSGGV